MNADEQKEFEKSHIVISNSELLVVLIAIGTSLAVFDIPQDFFVSLKTFFDKGVPDVLACSFVVFFIGAFAKSITNELLEKGNKKLMTTISCVIVVASLLFIKYSFFMSDEEKCRISGETLIDENSDNYQAGYEDGEKAGESGTIDDLSSNPDKYDMVCKENIMDYICDNYDREALISWYDAKSKSESSHPSKSAIDWDAIKRQGKELDSKYPSRGQIARKEERALYSKEGAH